jgi:hypothetical protein
MRAHILSVSLFVLFLAVRPALPQAAAESVLLNGHSATATAKAGTVLGNALNKTSNKIAGQIQAVPQSKIVTHKAQRAPQAQSHPPAPATTPANAGASMITSVQGGRVTHSSTTPATPSPK